MNHKYAYKPTSHNEEKFREKKQIIEIQLRKAKREEEFFKKRNINPGNIVANSSPDSVTTLQDITLCLKDPNTASDSQYLNALVALRHLISVLEPQIDLILQLGVLPKVVELLQHSDSNIVLQAAWILTNLTSGTCLQTKEVLASGVLPILMKLLLSSTSSLSVQQQVLWIIGNIAVDCNEYRRSILACGRQSLINSVINFAKINLQLENLRTVSWVICNLLRGKKTVTENEKIDHFIPTLAWMILQEDEEILVHVCWSFCSLSDGQNQKIQKIVDCGICQRVIHLLSHTNEKIVRAALRITGNIVSGNDTQTQYILNHSLLPAISIILLSENQVLLKEACWAISNILAGNHAQIQQVLDAQIFPALLNFIQSSTYCIAKEATYCIANTLSGATHIQIEYLIKELSIIPILSSQLQNPDSSILILVLQSVENILKSSNEKIGCNQYCLLFEVCGGLDALEKLQFHEEVKIYEYVSNILSNYFGIQFQDI